MVLAESEVNSAAGESEASLWWPRLSQTQGTLAVPTASPRLEVSGRTARPGGFRVTWGPPQSEPLRRLCLLFHSSVSNIDLGKVNLSFSRAIK